MSEETVTPGNAAVNVLSEAAMTKSRTIQASRALVGIGLALVAIAQELKRANDRSTPNESEKPA